MIFKISRTSGFSVDYNKASMSVEIKLLGSCPWNDEIRNIKKKYESTQQEFVEIKSVDELLLLIDKYGPIIIDDNIDSEGFRSIEIYDDYRE